MEDDSILIWNSPRVGDWRVMNVLLTRDVVHSMNTIFVYMYVAHIVVIDDNKMSLISKGMSGQQQQDHPWWSQEKHVTSWSSMTAWSFTKSHYIRIWILEVIWVPDQAKIFKCSDKWYGCIVLVNTFPTIYSAQKNSSRMRGYDLLKTSISSGQNQNAKL